MTTNLVTLNIQDNGVAQVTLNRPDKLNALNLDMFKAINKTISLIDNNKRIRVVILSGAGEDFCSGLDIKSVMSRPINAIKL
jgi:enoyl-CoA hydratase/carnithine racemase